MVFDGFDNRQFGYILIDHWIFLGYFLDYTNGFAQKNGGLGLAEASETSRRRVEDVSVGTKWHLVGRLKTLMWRLPKSEKKCLGLGTER